MKKFISLLISLLVVFSFAACNNKQTDSGSSSGGEAFIKPENYTSIVLVSINPQFRLYLNASGEVLALEPVNDDAKSIVENITAKSGNLDTVMESILSTAKDGGFVSDGVTVDLVITEIKSNDVDADSILTLAKTSADSSLRNLEVSAEVKTSVSSDAFKGDSDSSSSDEVSGHTHAFSEATCTEAKKCSCGETEGQALGHSYQNGVCSRCQAKDPNAVSYTSVKTKNGKWLFNFATGTKGYKVKMTLTGSPFLTASVGSELSTFPEEIREDMRPDCEQFCGGYYFFGQGDGADLGGVTEDGNTVTVLDGMGGTLVLTRTSENTMKVISSPAEFSIFQKIPVGTVLSFS